MKDNILDNLLDNNYYTTIVQSPQEFEKLFDDTFGLSDLNVSARVLNNWKDSGLLPDKGSSTSNHQENIGSGNIEREKGKRNKFNFFELIYLLIVQDLREFGFSFEKILKVKETLLQKLDFASEMDNFSKDDLEMIEKKGIDISLFNDIVEHKNDICNIIENSPVDIFKGNKLISVIIAVLISKFDVRIVITRDAEVTFELVNSVGQSPRTPANSQPHIALPIFLYLHRFLSMKKYKSLYVDFKLMDDQELLILDHVRSGKYKEVTIKFKKGDTILLELTEEFKTDNAKRLEEILLRSAYQDLQVSTQNGKISYSKIVTKKKI
jgi:hypothetical protein